MGVFVHSPSLADPTYRSSSITLRPIDLPLQIGQLRQLGVDFATLHTTLTALDAQPGSELLQQLGPKILAIHELTGRTLVHLSALDGSQYTAVPGSRSSLETLGEVVASACFAAWQLARAVADNPLEASAFAGGPPADDAVMRQARHAEAAPLLAESLTTAAHHLNLCATCCHYTASGITRDLERTASTSAGRPVPHRLSAAQYQALRSLAQGGATMQTRGRGSTMVCTPDLTVITTATFQSLDKRGLLHLDTSVPLYRGTEHHRHPRGAPRTGPSLSGQGCGHRPVRRGSNSDEGAASMTEFNPDERVLVSPRHLAGSGMSRFNDVIGPLSHLFNWRFEHNPSTGRIEIDSPCGSVFLDFEPDRRDDIWWELRHHEPYWTARFSRQTPAEALAAVTQVLPQLLGDTRHADRIPLTTNTLAQSAELNGWTVVRVGRITLFTSPDEHCHLRHERDAEVPWRFEHSLYESFDTEWSATFTRDTPERLVAQFFAHLASDEPVERAVKELPFLVQHSDSALITPVSGAAVNPHAHHAVAQAARAHAGRQPRR